MLKEIPLIILFSVMGAAVAKADINYNDGFCVKFDEEIKVENAVIEVRANFIVGRRHFIHGGKNFFNFKKSSDSNSLAAFDWGGETRIVKPAIKIHNVRNMAILHDFTHGGRRETILVKCSHYEDEDKKAQEAK